VRRTPGSLFVALALFTRGASADGGELALSYEAADGCPSRAEFEALVLARTRHIRFTDQAPRRSSVVLSPARGSVRGIFALEAPAGRAVRQIEARTCSQAADAMSLVVALAVDPEGVAASAVKAVQLAAPALPASPAPDPGPALVELSPEPSSAPPAAPALLAPEPPKVVSAQEAAAPAAVSPHGFSLGAAVEVETALAPQPVAGVALRGEYEVASSSWLAPSFGAELAGAASNVVEGAPDVAVWFATMRLDACPARVRLGGTGLTLRACGATAFGLLEARGVGAPNPETAVRGWVDAELRLRARWEGHRWFVGFDGGAVAPITRPKFVFLKPYQFVYEASQVGVLTALFAGVRF
jgi:hypothetical protein